MRECYVSFASAKEVHEFVSIATRQFFPIHVEQEDLRLNAKSIMSLFCMGLNRPFRVVIADADADPAPFWSAVEPYLVAWENDRDCFFACREGSARSFFIRRKGRILRK